MASSAHKRSFFGLLFFVYPQSKKVNRTRMTTESSSRGGDVGRCTTAACRVGIVFSNLFFSVLTANTESLVGGVDRKSVPLKRWCLCAKKNSVMGTCQLQSCEECAPPRIPATLIFLSCFHNSLKEDDR